MAVGKAHKLVVAAAAAACLALPSAAEAGGLAFTVNTTKDRLDAVPDDGFCLDGQGKCSLRAAISEVNDGGPTNQIVLPAGRFELTRPATGALSNDEGDLDLTQDATITGAGRNLSVIEQTLKDRVLFVHEEPGIMLAEISDLTVTGGVVSRDEDVGGSDASGGGILGQGELELSDVAVVGNRADLGGGIAVQAVAGSGVLELDLEDSVLRDNVARAAGGGIDVGTLAKAAVTDSRVAQNSAGERGGGISVSSGEDPISIERSTIAGNVADEFGGGIAAAPPAGTPGPLTLDSSTLSGNRAEDASAFFVAANREVDITNSTFTQNTPRVADEGNSVIAFVSSSPLTLRHTTIADNPGLKFGIDSRLIEEPEEDLVRLRASIVATQGKDCGSVFGTPFGFDSENDNVIGDQTCPGTSDDVVGDPLLKLLADNGGPTQTMALKGQSPAIDLVESDFCAATDQRGLPRPSGEGCEAGAFERQVP